MNGVIRVSQRSHATASLVKICDKSAGQVIAISASCSGDALDRQETVIMPYDATRHGRALLYLIGNTATR